MLGHVKNILFLCTGNICRSPFAEALCRKIARERGLAGIQADSAGVLALSGNHATAMAQTVAREHGVDLEDHRAKQITAERVAWADLVLVMEKGHERELMHGFDEAAGKVLLLRYFARCGSRNRGVVDPYGLNYEAYRFCFLDIEEAVCGLMDYLEGTTPTYICVHVSCYEGYKANELPRSFLWEGRRHVISDVLDRWYHGAVETGGMADYFKVRTEEGRLYLLRYDREQDFWEGRAL
jgi:protein-tyrosine phosphatase